MAKTAVGLFESFGSADEVVRDLEASGFRDVELLVKDAWMNSVVAATRD